MCRRRGWRTRQVGRQVGLGWLPSGRDCASPWSRRREGDIRRQRGVRAIQRRRADAVPGGLATRLAETPRDEDHVLAVTVGRAVEPAEARLQDEACLLEVL